MQCPNCNHPDTSHNDAGCFHDDGGPPCFCRASGEEIRDPEQFHQPPSMTTWFYDREITIVEFGNSGKYHFKTDKGESGDVVATSIDDMIEKIKFMLADDDMSHQEVSDELPRL